MPTSRTPARKPAAPAAAAADAIALLSADHQAVAKLHKKFERLVKAKAPASERGAVAQQICHALTLHATAEEEIFYPPVRAAIGKPDLMDEADIEHACAKDLIAQIESLSPEDDKYDARVIVLCEYVAHHVEEEETEMFPKAKRVKTLDMQALGEAIAARKAALAAELGIEPDGAAAKSRPTSRRTTRPNTAVGRRA